jgi:RHS repeat-associated protein
VRGDQSGTKVPAAAVDGPGRTQHRKLAAALALAVLVALAGFAASFAAADEPTQAQPAPVQPEAPEGEELVAKRTAYSNTFQLPNGERETQIYETPVNYRDENGDWQRIEEKLEPASSGGLTNAANSFDLHLPEEMGEGDVRVSDPDGWLSYRLLGITTDPAAVEGAMASYEAGNGSTFELHSLADGLKEQIVLKSPLAPHVYRFDLELSPGAEPSLAEDGSVEVKDAEGDLFATLPAPTIADANQGLAGPADAVHYSLDQAGEPGHWTLVVEADEAWLGDPNRDWPVTIDPTVLPISSTQDCTIGSAPLPRGWTSCGNLGSLEDIVAYSQKENQPVRSFFEFQISHSSMPSNAYISKAVLGLYAPAEAENTSALETRRVTKPWTTALNWERYATNSRGESLKWATPGGDFTSEGLAQVLTSKRGSKAGWWEFESESLRSLVAGWSAGTTENNGLLVKQNDETKTAECIANSANCPRRYVSFRSSASTPTETRPKLTLTYYPRAPKSSKLVLPLEGSVTARRLKLKAAWTEAGVTGVGFQFREGTKGPFQTIPPELLRDASNQPVSEFLPVTGEHESKLLYFDAAHATATLRKKGGLIQVRALFEAVAGSNASGVSEPVEATVDRFIGGPGDAIAPVGPGVVDLLTGNLTVDRSDVSISTFNSSLDFSRTFNSRGINLDKTSVHGGESPYEREMKNVLGPGWQPGIPVDQAGTGEWAKLELVEKTEVNEAEESVTYQYARLTSQEGVESSFAKEGESYEAPPELEGWSLTRNASGQFVLASPDGSQTIFSNGGAGTEYLPIQVTTSAGSGQTQMVYEVASGRRRLKMAIAPSPPQLTCTSENATTTSGCNALTFAYTTFAYGDRLTSIRYYGAGSSGMTSAEVAKYGYDAEGRLKEEWDPRISPALKETYTYEPGYQLHTITPPGEEPWTLEYGSFDEEEANGRLIAVKRPSLLASPSVAQTTIAYGVPVSGSGAPYEMGAATIANWAQQDIPVDATAIFPPDEVPGSSPPSSYARATVYYMDAEGMEVNVATAAGAGMSGPSISTSETDEFGNVVRELSPQNRLRALQAGSESAERSKQLDTHRQFSADGMEMQEEWGPRHNVRLQEGGSVVEARMHRTVQYDGGMPPEDHGPVVDPHVPTLETTGASVPGQATDSDQRITETQYDWSLISPTKTIVDPDIGGVSGLKITTTTVYDDVTGLPTEQRQPSNTAGGGAGTTKTIYYTYGHGGECEREAYAGLPCKIEPAAQPGTPGQPPLLVRKFLSYNQYGEPTEITESPGGSTENLRKTVVTYDAAGRETSKTITGGGTAVPKTETLYSETTGAPVVQRFCSGTGCPLDHQETTTAYDALGRPVSYEDADGNKATTTYDLLGRPVTSSDAKGSQTITYDSVTGLPVKLEDSGAGTFTAAYDANGNMVERTLPDGLTAKTTYDETGSPTSLTYTKASNCGASCTWLSFALQTSVNGQILAEEGSLATDEYEYDKAGRLVNAQERPTDGSCTTRGYTYDADSNRLSKTTRTSKLGFCGSGGTEQKYGYDSADRLTDEGIVYDGWGRITKLPAADAGGNELVTSYFSTDMVATQSQNGVTNTFELDGSLRQRSRLQAGGLEGTEVFHYDGPSDSPSWTERGSTWTRNIVGIGGELVAVQESGGGVTFELANLHGDVIATASADPAATKLLATSSYDEFGNSISTNPGRFGWLGANRRRTEFQSGVIQMGVRSYVPAIGRFTSVDPAMGGSASAYDYANQDPGNTTDLSGENTEHHISGLCSGIIMLYSDYLNPANYRGGYGKLHLHWLVKCAAIVSVLKVTHYLQSGGHIYFRHSAPTAHPDSPHWEEFGTGLYGRGKTYTCLYGLEYRYVYEFQYQYVLGLELKQGTFSMSAHAVCGTEV